MFVPINGRKNKKERKKIEKQNRRKEKNKIK